MAQMIIWFLIVILKLGLGHVSTVLDSALNVNTEIVLMLEDGQIIQV